MGGKKFDQNQCKVQLKLAISRLKLQKNKKDNQIKDHKREIAELLKAGKDESARIKVESVIREDFIIEAYEILELFCELILARLGVISISKDCPPDIREAVCTIIYAAPRAEIKELSIIREMLIIKFGKELATNAVHNKDNCVNARIVHKLSIQTPENYLVFQYLNEIAKTYNLEWKADFAPEPIKIETPVAVMAPIFPEPPKAFSTSVPEPMFPSFPSTSSPVIPTFNPNAMPGGSYGNPSFPSSNGSNMPDFPSPPRGSSNGSNMPDFPSPPSFSQGSVPNFPSTPSGGNSSFDFPSPPKGSSNGSNIPDFPSPPSSSSTPVFPSPPGSDSSSSVPDFDELTARFEKLKKRDL